MTTKIDAVKVLREALQDCMSYISDSGWVGQQALAALNATAHVAAESAERAAIQAQAGEAKGGAT